MEMNYSIDKCTKGHTVDYEKLCKKEKKRKTKHKHHIYLSDLKLKEFVKIFP